MDSTLPPDLYEALGVAKDATAEAIKKEYRKLVLKAHPDKVQDESKKQAAADLFHKIQTAYETLGNDAKRHRYDAQCKLAELRKDVFARDGGGARSTPNVRTGSYEMPREGARSNDYFFREPDYSYPPSRPVYEERRPSYVERSPERRPMYADDFEPPRPTSKKEPDFERSSKRASPRADRGTDRGRARGGAKKENDRSDRKEKTKRADKDTRRDRDQKYHAPYVEVMTGSESDSDPSVRTQRRMREEDDLRREQHAREMYYAQARQQREQAEQGFYQDERARKMFEKEADARDYIQRASQQQRPEPRSEPLLQPEPRPSPMRQGSSKDKVEYIKREGKPPIMIRRGSDRPKPTTRDSERRKSPAVRERERERQTPEIVEEPPTPVVEPSRRPPTLNQSKSSPADIRPPFERQRSHSLQEDHPIENRIPQVKRSDTMPASPTEEPESHRRRDSRRKEGSKLRTEVKSPFLTPSGSPEPPQSKRFDYSARDREYADDNERATPDGYKTEYREPDRTETRQARRESLQPDYHEPPLRGFTRSPSPMKERSRERARTNSRRVSPQAAPPTLGRSTSHQYVFPEGNVESSYKRPPVSRENSARLYGEVPTTHSPRPSPRPTSTSRYTPDMTNVQYTRDPRPEDVRMQSGYRPRSGERPPSYNRSASAQQHQSVYVK